MPGGIGGMALKLATELEALARRMQLEQLYLIEVNEYSSPTRIVVGARGRDVRPSVVEAVKDEVTRAAAEDHIVGANVIVLTGAHEEVEYLLDEKIRPAVAAHGGAVGVISIHEADGSVVLSLRDACSGCPHSMATLRLGIESAFRRHLPWFRTVRSAEEPRKPEFGFYLDH